MDWKSAINGFKQYLMLERGLSANTLEAYVHDVHRLLEYCTLEGETLPDQVDKGDIEGFLAWIHDLGLGARTQSRLLSGIRTFYKFMVLEDAIAVDPTELIENPRIPRKIPDVLTIEEIDAMLEAIDLSLPQGPRDRAILETLYACGLRVSELVNLRISNLFLDVGLIKVIGKNNKERLVPIGGSAIHYIKLYLDHNRLKKEAKKGSEDIVFLNHRGGKLSRVAIFNIVKKTADQAGIKKNVSPHIFRHSFATHLVEGGADLRAVQDMLGHESITTTEIYTHLDLTYLRRTMEKYHPLHKK